MAKRTGILCALCLGWACSHALGGDGWLQQADYRLAQRISLKEIREGASGLAFDPVARHLWLVTDNGKLFELNAEGSVLRQIVLRGFADPEALSWLDTVSGVTRLAVSEERSGQVLAIKIGHGTREINIDQAARLAQFHKQGSNQGVEGLAYDPVQKTLFAVTESKPQAVYTIHNQQLSELWRVGLRNFWREPLDYAGAEYVPQTDSLLIVSDRNRSLREYSRSGQLIGKLRIEASDPEGVALAPDGRLYICSEPRLLMIYRPAAQLP